MDTQGSAQALQPSDQDFPGVAAATPAIDAQIYAQTQPYSDKQFLEPRRYTVPVPTIKYDDGNPSFDVKVGAPFHRVSAAYGDPSFLNSIIACGDLHLAHSMHKWKYEMRRQAQQILPFLYLGPSCAARDSQFVKEAGVTFLVAVRNATVAKARPSFLDPSKTASDLGILHQTVDLDNPYELRMRLKTVIKTVNDHLQQTSTVSPITSLQDIGGRVFVYCETGNERSTALVAAYLMVMFGIDSSAAIQTIQAKRFCISPEDAMKEMLIDLGRCLQAEREVASAIAAESQTTPMLSGNSIAGDIQLKLNRSTKRNIDRAQDEDEDIEDAEWFSEETQGREGRSGVAPFTDSRT